MSQRPSNSTFSRRSVIRKLSGGALSGISVALAGKVGSTLASISNQIDEEPQSTCWGQILYGCEVCHDGNNWRYEWCILDSNTGCRCQWGGSRELLHRNVVCNGC